MPKRVYRNIQQYRCNKHYPHIAMDDLMRYVAYLLCAELEILLYMRRIQITLL